MTREEAEAKYGVALTADNLYPDRNCLHRNMGPPELFPCCFGRGYYDAEDHPTPRYCLCAAGVMRRQTDR